MLENYSLIDIDLTNHNNIELLFVETEFANTVIKQYKQFKDVFDRLQGESKKYIHPLINEFFKYKSHTYEGSSIAVKITKKQYKKMGEPRIGDVVNICMFMNKRN